MVPRNTTVPCSTTMADNIAHIWALMYALNGYNIPGHLSAAKDPHQYILSLGIVFVFFAESSN